MRVRPGAFPIGENLKGAPLRANIELGCRGLLVTNLFTNAPNKLEYYSPGKSYLSNLTFKRPRAFPKREILKCAPPGKALGHNYKH